MLAEIFARPADSWCQEFRKLHAETNIYLHKKGSRH